MNLDPHRFKNIVILTGAGISAESGINTFRDSQGLWEEHRMEDVATPEAFQKDTLLVWRFYSMRRIQSGGAHPNPAHEALVEFAKSFTGQISLITQNVDNLHQKADPKELLDTLSMHGSLNESSCTNCGNVYFDDYAYFNLAGDYAPQSAHICTKAQIASANYLHQYRLEYRNFLPLSPCCKAVIRPHIVWFGEVPLHMARIVKLLSSADLFVSIGTSGVVYPAAGFLQTAKTSGAATVCINKESLPQSAYIDCFIQGEAGMEVPKFFKKN